MRGRADDGRSLQPPAQVDVAIVGGGQAGLAAGHALRRSGLDVVVLDAASEPGGSWRHMWPSLTAFSPARFSSLPGWPMPGPEHGNPTRDEVIDYLERYEQRYDLRVHRDVAVDAVHRDGETLRLDTTTCSVHARAVISATGTWSEPVVPQVPGHEAFRGEVLHAVDYAGPEPFAGRRVLVAGGGNSGAQILAEVSTVADTIWTVTRAPRLLPDHVDGRILFEVATRRFLALQRGEPDPGGVGSLGDIVATPDVRAARDRGVLVPNPPFDRFTPDGVSWDDGSFELVDVIIWCTGFRPALSHLEPLGLTRTREGIAVHGTRSIDEPRLWLLGYGDWTGDASATLVGVGRTARNTAKQITAFLA